MTETIKILIADDNEMMRLVMKRLFTKYLNSPSIAETKDLPDTINYLKEETIDFLLLDINMPRGDSNPATVREILAIQPGIKICMFSGNDKALLEQDYLNAGAIGFVQKDENMSDSLQQVINSVLN
ncbi:response regulator transcription factor [Pedobacter miscanthi]|jgi:two-component system invasion response regulator UvrY|uniref:response regulator n=1 Tax=Pedobacter miscanthi TaxID=2259170 RepID=UPI002930D03D|nr:response regulator transcription factor [Pedobacter miscanthi]